MPTASCPTRPRCWRRCVLPWASPYDDAMLSWPAGPKPEDGVWAEHWYASAHRSTGFGPPPSG